MTHPAIQMYEYHIWATKTMINHLKSLPEDIYTTEVQSVFPTIARVLSHIYVVDRNWWSIINGIPMADAMAENRALQSEVEALPLKELEDRFLRLFDQVQAQLHELDIEATITLDNPYTRVRETSYAEIMLQVVNHGTYHRGNMTAMLRQMGHPSTMTEYALFWYV